MMVRVQFRITRLWSNLNRLEGGGAGSSNSNTVVQIARISFKKGSNSRYLSFVFVSSLGVHFCRDSKSK